MNNTPSIGLQGIAYGAGYQATYPAHIEALYRRATLTRQALHRLLMMEQQGREETPAGNNVAECIAFVSANLDQERAELARAEAEL